MKCKWENPEGRKYWVEGTRKQIINGQAVIIKEDVGAFERYREHMKPIEKARKGRKKLVAEAIMERELGTVKFTRQGKLWN